jgi:hypothetical protein
MVQDDPDIDRILSRFPGPITISSLTRRSIAVTALLLAAIMMVPEVVVFDSPYLMPKLIPGLVGVAVLLLSAFLGAARLYVDGAGFEVVSPLNTQFIAWDNVEAFEVKPTNLGRGVRVPLVYCRVRHPSWPADLPEIIVDRWFLSRSFDGTSLSTERLARLLTLWRDRAMVPPTAAKTVETI